MFASKKSIRRAVLSGQVYAHEVGPTYVVRPRSVRARDAWRQETQRLALYAKAFNLQKKRAGEAPADPPQVDAGHLSGSVAVAPPDFVGSEGQPPPQPAPLHGTPTKLADEDALFEDLMDLPSRL